MKEELVSFNNELRLQWQTYVMFFPKACTLSMAALFTCDRRTNSENNEQWMAAILGVKIWLGLPGIMVDCVQILMVMDLIYTPVAEKGLLRNLSGEGPTVASLHTFLHTANSRPIYCSWLLE